MKRLFMLMSPDGDGGTSALGGSNGGVPAANDPNGSGSGIPDAPPSSPPPSIYGELNVAWPDGLEDALRNEPSIKPFVDKEGKINYANVLKSYVHTKKSFGNKVSIPSEHATDLELNEFWSKFGFKQDPNEYTIEEIKDAKIPKEELDKFKEFAHKNRLPLNTANQLAKYLNDYHAQVETGFNTGLINQIKTGLESVQKEYGQAYEHKLGMAKRVINDLFSDNEEIMKGFEDPLVGNSPTVIKTLVKIAEKFYKEDGSVKGTNSAVYSPEEAQKAIGDILSDSKHPYNIANHPNHDMAVKEVLKLFEASKR